MENNWRVFLAEEGHFSFSLQKIYSGIFMSNIQSGKLGQSDKTIFKKTSQVSAEVIQEKNKDLKYEHDSRMKKGNKKLWMLEALR